MARTREIGVVLALAGCGPSAADYAYERATHACLPGVCTSASSPVDAGAPDAAADGRHDAGARASRDAGGLEPWPDTNAGPRSGVYAMNAVVTADVVGMQVDLDLLFRVRLLQDADSGAHVMQSTALCGLKLPSVPGLATLGIPMRLETILAQQTVTVTEGDFLPGPAASQRYAPPTIVLLGGAMLAHPSTDPLPTMTDPAGEWDEDQDGFPGVTVDATVFLCTAPQELYVAIRTGGTLSGQFGADGSITGTASIFEEQSVLGYSDPCLSAAMEINPKLDPTATFEALRLADEALLDAQGDVSCADILPRAPTLFPSAWGG